MERSDVVPVAAPLPESFEDWYERVAPALCRSLVAYGASVEEAQDLVATATLRALTRWKRLTTGNRAPDAWAFRVAINLFKRQRRRDASEARATSVTAWTTSCGSKSDVVPDVDLWSAVTGLPERQRQAIALRYFGDLTEQQVAHVMHISEGAVSATLVKARATLRSNLKEVSDDELD